MPAGISVESTNDTRPAEKFRTWVKFGMKNGFQLELRRAR